MACAAIGTLANDGEATTRTVPAQHSTIQQGIWASSQGDTVLVLPGTYVENIVIDRAIVVRSAQGPQATIIDGGAPANPDSASTVTMFTGTIQGFSIRNGHGTLNPEIAWRTGGGIVTGTSLCVIRNNWIHHNTLQVPLSDPQGQGNGAGIWVHYFGSAVISFNRVYDNSVVAHGGTGAGLSVGGPSSIVEDNEIFDNHMERGAFAGITLTGTLRRNVIACNSAPGDGFAVLQSGDLMESNTIVAHWDPSIAEDPAAILILPACQTPVDPIVFGNVIAFNLGYGLTCYRRLPCHVDLQCNDFYGNSAGQTTGECPDVVGTNNNIALDPLFGQGNCPPQPGDWCLSNGSPLLPQNSPPGCGLIGARGACAPIGIADQGGSAPAALSAPTVAPNPFPERTTLGFYLSREGAVEVAIHGVLGRRVRTLHAGVLMPGEHALQWDGRTDQGTRAASGAYVAVIRTGAEEVTRTLLLLR